MDSKPWYMSKTVWGGLLSIVGIACPRAIAALGGSDAAADQIITVVGAGVTLVGGILAIYGRVKASTTIGLRLPPRNVSLIQLLKNEPSAPPMK